MKKFTLFSEKFFSQIAPFVIEKTRFILLKTKW